MSIAALPVLLGYASLGLVSATLHFALLSMGVRTLVSGTSWIIAVSAGLARATVSTAIFAYAGSHGALPLCAALVGFLGARSIAIGHAEIMFP
jgi:hypothetical protein